MTIMFTLSFYYCYVVDFGCGYSTRITHLPAHSRFIYSAPSPPPHRRILFAPYFRCDIIHRCQHCCHSNSIDFHIEWIKCLNRTELKPMEVGEEDVIHFYILLLHNFPHQMQFNSISTHACTRNVNETG